MAAGAYKGLTIRIGADTTKLSSALRGANSVIYKTESELRKLSKAAKIDPGNNKVYSAQMGAMANEAMAAAKKVDTLNKSITEMRGQQATGENATLGMIADDTENAALAAENAKDRYNSLSAEIERVSDSIQELSGIDLSEAVRESSEAYEEAKNKLLEWASAAENQDAVQRWEERNGVSIEAAINDLEYLRDTWQEAGAQFDDAKLVEALHNAEVEASVTEVKVKELGQALADMKVSSDFGRTFSDLDSRIQLTTAAVDTATDRFTRLDQAAKLNPTNLGLAIDRAKALAEATEAARAKAALLQEKIQGYKDAGIDKVASSMGNIALEVERSKQAYAETEAEVARLKGELDNATVAYQRLSEVGHSDDMAKSLNEASDECDRLERELKEAEAAREAALSRYDTAQQCSELQELETQARETNSEIRELGKVDLSGLTNFGSAAVIAAQQLGQLAERGGQKVIESSNDVDAAYRNLRKTFDSSESDYKMLYDAAMQYSQANVTSADTMLDMEATAAQLGVHLSELADGSQAGAEGIQRFAEAAANLDVATDIDADSIALQMGQIMNVMSDLNTENVDRFGDALVRLGNNMPTQESNIMQITQRLSAIGNVAGFTTPELLGIAAAVASTGQKSEAAATGVSTLISKITAAVDDFEKGGDSLDKYAEVAGKSADEFAKAWRDKPIDALKELIRSLGESETLFSDLTDMDVNSVRQTQTIASLSQTVDNMNRAIGMADDAFNGLDDEFGKAGDAANEANKKAQGFSGTLSKLQNSGQVLAATFGDAMVPFMEALADKLNWLTEVVNSWSNETKSSVVLAAGSFVAFSTAYPIISTLASSLVTMGTSMAGLVTGGIAKLIVGGKAAISLFGSFVKAPVEVAGALSTLGGSAGALGTALGFLATPLGVVVGGIGLLAAALGGTYIAKMSAAKRSADQFRTALEGIEGVTKNLGQSLYLGGEAIDDYAEKWSAARVNMDEYHKELQTHIDSQMDARQAIEQTVGSFDKYQGIIDKAIGKGQNYAGNIGELQYAIDKLNEMTGSSWQLQDILTGKYQDETGAIRDTKTALDELIESKKREAQISGIETALAENEAMQQQNKLQRELAASAYQDWIDLKLAHKDDREMFKGMTNSEYISWLQANDEHTQELMLDSKKLRTEAQLLGEQYDDLTLTLGGLIDKGSFATSANYGERESIMQLGDGVRDLLKSYLGFTDGTVDQGIKDIARGMQDLNVGTTEFAEMAPSTFQSLLAQAEGSKDKFIELVAAWNESHLEEKYGNITWGDESKTWFIDAQNRRVEWNGNEWEVKATSVEVDDSQVDEAQAKEQAVQDKAAEGANMEVTTDDSDLDETQAKIESQTDEDKTVTYTTDDSEVDATSDKVASLEDKTVNVTFNVDDSGLSDITDKLSSIEDKNINVKLVADTGAASEVTETVSSLSQLDGKKISVKLTADTGAASQVTNAVGTLSELDGKKISVKLTADTSAAAQVTETVNGLSVLDGKKINIFIAAVTNGVATATAQVGALNANAAKMTNTTRIYTAKGTATTASPGNNIRNLNSAAGSMRSTSKSYNASGNAANGSAASNIWNLVSAVNNMHSKSVTITTYEKTVKNATGGYVPASRIPRHAEGIFTHKTLTNIGWVGESGAELYSGNSLVPLTNRKYSMPYIDDISDAVAKKLGDGGTTYNLYVNDAVVNSDDEIQAAIMSLFDVLLRKGAMNVG